eukprot:7430906-Pyramimonas_sp.AAC.1
MLHCSSPLSWRACAKARPTSVTSTCARSGTASSAPAERKAAQIMSYRTRAAAGIFSRRSNRTQEAR